MTNARIFKRDRDASHASEVAPGPQKARLLPKEGRFSFDVAGLAARTYALALVGAGFALAQSASVASVARADAADLGQVPSERARVSANVSDNKETLTLNEAAASVGQIEAAEACLSAQKATQAAKLRQLESAKAQLKARAGTPQESGARLIVQTLLTDMGEVQRTALQCGKHLRSRPSATAQGRIINQLKEQQSSESALRPAGYTRRASAEPAPEMKPENEAAPLALNVRLISTKRSGGRGAMGTPMARKAIASTASALSQCYDGYVERKSVEPITLEVELRFAQRAAARRLRLRTLRPGDVDLHACTKEALQGALSTFAPASGWSAFVYQVHIGPYDPYAQPQTKSAKR